MDALLSFVNIHYLTLLLLAGTGVLLFVNRRVEIPATRFFVPAPVLVEENGDYTLWVQDRYEYNAEDKWAAFTQGIQSAACGERGIALHFLSTKGTAAYGHPYSYAAELNERLMDEPQLRGWIVVDFGSALIAKKIYRMNQPDRRSSARSPGTWKRSALSTP